VTGWWIALVLATLALTGWGRCVGRRHNPGASVRRDVGALALASSRALFRSGVERIRALLLAWFAAPAYAADKAFNYPQVVLRSGPYFNICQAN
jgi:hypothetical protein